MFWHTLILTILTGSSVASLTLNSTTLPDSATVASPSSTTSTPSIPTPSTNAFDCYNKDGHFVCPKMAKMDDGVPQLWRRTKKGTKKPITGATKPKPKPKPHSSQKPKAAKTGVVKPKATKNPKTTKKPKATKPKATKTGTQKPKATKPASSKCKRGDGASSKGGQPSCDMGIMGVINVDDIPSSVTCAGIGNGGPSNNKYSQSDIRAAVNRGIQYAASNKKATRSNYPHPFKNTEGLKLLSQCDGKPIQEFPIIPGGVFDVSANAQGSKAGIDRVIFSHPNRLKPGEVDESNGEVFYCGIITHSEPKKANGNQGFHPCT